MKCRYQRNRPSYQAEIAVPRKQKALRLKKLTLANLADVDILVISLLNSIKVSFGSVRHFDSLHRSVSSNSMYLHNAALSILQSELYPGVGIVSWLLGVKLSVFKDQPKLSTSAGSPAVGCRRNWHGYSFSIISCGG